MQDSTHKKNPTNFALRVKVGEYEIEVAGTREEVIKTVEELPGLMSKVNKALENVKPKTVTTLTVKAEPTKESQPVSKKYPSIPSTRNLDEAILSLLETEWGKWRPHTLNELKEALKSNGIDHSAQALSRILMDLVKKERIRRWNTDAGYVYILAEKETLGMKGESQ